MRKIRFLLILATIAVLLILSLKYSNAENDPDFSLEILEPQTKIWK